MNRRLFLLLALAICASSGCSNGSNDKHKFSGTYPIKAACTTGMVADLVRHVGGKHVAIDQLMPHGTDPHNFKANNTHTERLEAADVIFYSGLHLEGHMGDIFKDMASKKLTCAVAERIHAKSILNDDKAEHDPHAWFDVSLWREAAGVVRDVLIAYDPKNADDYKANAEKYQAELAALHEETKKELAAIPKGQRVLITSHDAFRYFGRAYEIEVRGIQGISTADEPSLKDMNDLVDFMVERKVKAYFVESSVNPRNMEALVGACQKRGHKVYEGGMLFSDAMGRDGTPEGTYVGMIRHNVRTIVGALK